MKPDVAFGTDAIKKIIEDKKIDEEKCNSACSYYKYERGESD